MEINDVLNHAGQTALAVFGYYILYYLLFQKGQHFQFNRFFILLALVFSFAFPFLSFDLGVNTFSYFNSPPLMEDFWEPTGEGELIGTFPIDENNFRLLHWIILIYVLGVILFLVRYLFKLFLIIQIIRQNEKIKFNSFTLIKLKGGVPTYSFGPYIFSDQMPDKANKAMFDHEKCHIDQGHSHDLLLVELLLALQWFNPFIYLFKNKLVEMHEFLADEKVLKNGHDKVSYMKLLCSVSCLQIRPQITCSFHSNILKRIKTMNQHKFNRLTIWKTILPIVFGIAIIFLHSGFKNENYQVSFLKDHLSFDTYIEMKPIFHQPIKKGDLIKITAGFGMRMHPILKENRMHNGIDYKAASGTKIYAPMKGTVIKAGHYGAFGNYIILDHGDGFSSRYAHLAQIDVEENEVVSQDQLIGTVGETGMSVGPHLHFEILKDDVFVDPDTYLEPFQ